MIVSKHLESVVETLGVDSTDTRLLRDIIPMIRQLEARNERIESRHRALRLKYNAIKKAVEIVRAVTNDAMLDPYKPESSDNDE